MVSCLICLEIINVSTDSININSAQWEEFDIARQIEKYFWPLINIRYNSCICVACWKEVNNFHKFYLRIEKAHLNLTKTKSEPGVENIVCKEEWETQIHNEYNEESDKDNMECGLLQPEILLYQTESHNLKEQTASDKSNIEHENDIPLNEARRHFQSIEDQADDNDPLKKADNVSVNKSRKSKRLKKEIVVLKNSSDGKEITNVPKNINSNDSDTRSDEFECNKSFAHKSKSKQINEIKAKTICCKSRIKRAESDKFISEHLRGMSCNICQTPLENFSATLKHFSEIHKQKGYAFCCNRKFLKRIDLVDHIHCHLNPYHFKCTNCDKILSDRIRLEKHKINVHGSEEKIKNHCCDKCGKSFLHLHYLRLHKLTHLSDAEKKFPCQECGKFYGSSYLLHRHIQAVHLKKFVKICYICGKSLSSNTDFKIHMNKHEGIPQPLIKCDICGLRLTTERGLKIHKDTQHPVDGKKDHHCPKCPKISPTLKALRKHINTMHEKRYDHKCSICQKAFKRPEVLREHMASHTGTPLYTCPWCPKTFNSNGNMHAHRKKIHPKEWEEAKLQKLLQP